MDMHDDEIYVCVFDKPLNNHYLEKCIQFPPSRNKIVSTITNLSNSIKLVNTYIFQFFQYLQELEFITELFDDDTIELQGNEFNVGLKIMTKINIKVDFLLKCDRFCISYFQINDAIYINNYYKCRMNDIIIYRSFDTFHQNDDIVRYYLYTIIQIKEKINNLILIGGEMYGFHKLIESNNLYCYCYCKNRIDDTYKNIDISEYDLIDIKQIKYCDIELKYLEDTYIICNNGKKGLEEKLCMELIKVKAKKIFIISCNKKSFIRDYAFLKSTYNLVKSTIINNITIYELL